MTNTTDLLIEENTPSFHFCVINRIPSIRDLNFRIGQLLPHSPSFHFSKPRRRWTLHLSIGSSAPIVTPTENSRNSVRESETACHSNKRMEPPPNKKHTRCPAVYRQSPSPISGIQMVSIFVEYRAISQSINAEEAAPAERIEGALYDEDALAGHNRRLSPGVEE